MAEVCPSCKSSTLTQDEHGGQSHLVCTACGQVVDSDTCYQQERDYWGGVTSCSAWGSYDRGRHPGRHRSPREADPTAPSRALRPWLSYLREVCGVMCLTPEMERGALALLGRAFRSGEVKFKQRERKRALCAAVLYTVCRQHDWPVALSDVGAAVQSAPNDVFAMQQLLASELNVRLTAPGIEDVVERVLKRHGLEEPAFVAKTVKLVSLAKEAWITSGRSHDAAICAAAFLVWKSTPEGRPKGSKLPSFRQWVKGKLPTQTTQRVREMRGILVQLAGQLPWLQSKTVTQDTATLYLDDILRHKKYLIAHVKVPEEADVIGSGEDMETRNSLHDDGTTNPSSSKSPPSRPTGCLLPPSMNQAMKRKRRPTDDSSDGESPSKRRDRTLLPVEGAVSMDKELTDRDIPESEMHLYLRSESEVAALESLQERVMAQGSSDGDSE